MERLMKAEDAGDMTTSLVAGYQHVSNGGIHFDLDRRDYTYVRATDDEQVPKMGLTLTIGLSNMGVNMVANVPVFKTTADILQAIVDQIREQPVPTQFEYLSSDYATVQIRGGEEQYYATKSGTSRAYDRSELFGGQGGVSCSSEATPDQDVQSLDDLMMLHRISLIPQYESASWSAHAYDHDSEDATRVATGPSPRAAVDAVLALPIPPESE
jgi:hypothetical protein